MESRNAGNGGASGMGEVHSHLSQPDKGLGMSGRYEGQSGQNDMDGSTESLTDEVRHRAEGMVDEVRERAGEAMDEVRERADEMRGRAGVAAGKARARAAEVVHKAEQQLDDRTGVISLIRDNPIPALGAAFAIGYLAAGSNEGSRGRFARMATGQLRAAIMGGVTAALTRELRSIVQEQGGSLGAFAGMGSSSGESGSTGSTSGYSGGSRY